MAENYQELNRLERARFGGGISPYAESSIARLFSGGADQQANYLKGAQQGATLANIMAEARQRQLAGVAREALAKQADEAGNHDLANMFRAGTTGEDLARTGQTFQTTQHRGQMFNDAQDPNKLETLNREVLAMANAPVSLSAVEGNSIVDRFKTADHQSFAPTAVGQADISEKGAQAKAADARAVESYAQAERARQGAQQDKTQVVDTPDGIFVVNKNHPDQSLPAMFQGAPLKKPPKADAKLGEGELNAALRGVLPAPTETDDATKLNPAMMQRYIETKQAMGAGASDADVIQRLREQTQGAATDTAPQPYEAPNALVRMFTGAPSNADVEGGQMPNTMPRGQTNIFQNAPAPKGLPPGARLAPDGKYYVPDPDRPGKYLRIDSGQ